MCAESPNHLAYSPISNRLDLSRFPQLHKSDKFCDKESGVRKVVLRGSIRNVVMAQQLIMDLVWEEMETAIGVMQFMIPDEVACRGQFAEEIPRIVSSKNRSFGTGFALFSMLLLALSLYAAGNVFRVDSSASLPCAMNGVGYLWGKVQSTRYNRAMCMRLHFANDSA